MRSSPDGLKSVFEYLYQLSAKISLHAPLHWIQSTHSIETLELLLTEKRAKYHKTCFHKCYMKNKRSSERGSQNVERSRAKRKSSTEAVAPVECVYCGEKEKDLSKMSKKKLQKNRNSLRNYTKQGNTIQVFRVLMYIMSRVFN